MLGYAVRRLGAALVVVWVTTSAAFVVLRWLPGDAVDATLARSGASAEYVEIRRDELGLNDPWFLQYVAYLVGIVRGDWGESLVSGQSVTALIGQNLSATVALAASAMLVSIVAGISLGLTAGLGRFRLVTWLAEGLASLALSTPVYWTATLAIYVFTVLLGVLPGVGGNAARHLILPACVLGFHAAGSIAQVTARSVREASFQDFVRTARAKGLPDPDVIDHILRVGLLPVVAVIALQLGFLLGGTVITETIFVRRGLGRVLLTAIDNRDYPVIQGLVALSAFTYSVVNAVADVIYVLIDPRVVEEGRVRR